MTIETEVLIVTEKSYVLPPADIWTFRVPLADWDGAKRISPS